MTGADLRVVSGLPRRTIYEALRTLRERGVVKERQSLRDTRQKFFWLVGNSVPPPLLPPSPHAITRGAKVGP